MFITAINGVQHRIDRFVSARLEGSTIVAFTAFDGVKVKRVEFDPKEWAAAQRLLFPIIPAAPGFLALTDTDDLADAQTVIAWRIADVVVPVTIDGPLDSCLGVIRPDGRVVSLTGSGFLYDSLDEFRDINGGRAAHRERRRLE